MVCSCADDKTGLKCFLISEDHLWISTSWNWCAACQSVWCEDEESGWSRVPFEKICDPNVWVTGVMGVYPEKELVDPDTFSRWVGSLDQPLHTCPMV